MKPQNTRIEINPQTLVDRFAESLRKQIVVDVNNTQFNQIRKLRKEQKKIIEDIDGLKICTHNDREIIFSFLESIVKCFIGVDPDNPRDAMQELERLAHKVTDSFYFLGQDNKIAKIKQKTKLEVDRIVKSL